jgi:glycosyltransferase involved in cell wall biosynthesis
MSRVLFVSRWFPFPPGNGSKLRVFNLLRILATRHEVTLVSLTEPGETKIPARGPGENGPLNDFCHAIYTMTRKPFDANSGRAWLAFFAARPRSVIDTWSEELAGLLRTLTAREAFDAVIASQIDTAAYASCFGGRPALFEEVELGLMHGQFADAAGLSRRLRHRLTWAKHRRYLNSLSGSFAACTVASEAERDLLIRSAPGFNRIEIIPNGVHLPDYAGVAALPEPGRVIFTGAFTYSANYEAASWFVGEVYPRLKARFPAARLTITGDHAGLPLPPAPDVTLTGFVPDVRPLIAGAWASVAPMRQGGGTRLKILEAMALGTPVVATRKGAEGLDAEPGRHLLIADDPEAFAEATARLLAEPELRRYLAENARQLVATKYDWQQIAPRFLQLVEGVITDDMRLAAGAARVGPGIAAGGAPTT